MANVLHPTYLPFAADQLRERFAPVAGPGDRDRHLRYYLASVEEARKYDELIRGGDKPTRAQTRLGRHGRVVAFEDLGIHRLLLQVPDLDELRSFAREVIGALSEHEAQHRSGLLRTLAAYLRENGSLQRAARELHVHPNTVTYRLNRVESIAGLDLGRYQDRLMAQVALEIVEALEER